MSAQPCGCDPGCGDYKCERHRNASTPLTIPKDANRIDPSLLTGERWIENGQKLTPPTNAKIIIHPLDTPEGRKQRPLITGVLDYFPDALLEIALCSYIGNEQHNPGTPLHWDRSKSMDEADACGRHLKDRGTIDSDGVRHSAKAAWRALALLQKEIEKDRRKRFSDGSTARVAPR